MNPEPVRICGLGVRAPEETTLEALIALEDCRVVFCAVKDKKAVAWLKKRVRLKVPKSAREIVDAAAQGGPVGLAVWGHPQFSSEFAREVQAGLRAAGLGFRVYGAVSPVGSAFARSVSFLGGDYGYQGAQCYALETLLADPSMLSQELPLVVFAERAAPARWGELITLLRSRFAAGHEVRAYPSGSDAELRLPLSKLSPGTLSGGVLLVPPPAGAPKRPHDVAQT